MSRYVFSIEAENDLMEIYQYGFLNYGENKADLYINALKEQCQFLSVTLSFVGNGKNSRRQSALIIIKNTCSFTL